MCGPLGNVSNPFGVSLLCPKLDFKLLKVRYCTLFLYIFPSSMSINSSVSYLLINWLDDYLNVLPFIFLCLSWTSGMGCHGRLPSIPWPPGHRTIPSGYPCALGQRVPSLASNRSFLLPFVIKARKSKHHIKTQGSSWPGRAA